MDFRIEGLAADLFSDLYGLSEEALAHRNARRYVVDAKPGFPDRIELRDAEPGETVILVNHTHQAACTPYHASHAIFVREGALRAYDQINAIPEVLRLRTISLRAFSADHWMLDAKLCDGKNLEVAVHECFGNPDVAYLQAHFATRGCYAARISRVATPTRS